MLVAVPLFFEVMVASALMFFQHLYVKAVEDETTGKLVIYNTNRLWLQSVNMMIDHGALTFAVKAGNLSNWNEDFAAIQEQYQELRALLVDTEQRKRLDNLKAYIDKIHTLSRPPEKPLSLENASVENLEEIGNALKTTRRLTRAALQVAKAFRQFKQPLLEKGKRAESDIERNRQFIELVLLAAVVGSVVVAAFLFRYFIQDVYSEIQALTANIERFKAGQPLVPLTDCGDEVTLLHQRFQETASAVRESQREKQEFVQTISRFLRDPLNRVLFFVKDLAGTAEQALDKKTLEGAKRSEKSLARLILLLDDLLALNARVKPELEIALQPVGLSELVSSSVDAMSIYGSTNPIQVEVDDDIQILADSARIVQVIVNLLSNAIKFSPPRATIFITAVRLEQSIEVRVTDAGRGIPKEMQETIFEPFRQVKASDGTEKGGTGLGLPICKHIVERHGGIISVESEPGKGTTFWFRIPVVPGDTPVIMKTEVT